MLAFLHSSKVIVLAATKLVLEAEKAKGKVKEQKISEAIRLLREIGSTESRLYKKISHNEEGLAQEVLEIEVGKTLRITQEIIQLLENKKNEEALEWLEVLIKEEVNVHKWIQQRMAVLEHDRKLAKNIKPILKRYVKNGMAVAELFHGEHADILTALSLLVGKRGHVYGLDELNPFKMCEHMTAVDDLPNVDLIKATFPEMPIPKVDAIIVREFGWINQAGDKKVCYAALDQKLKRGGFLILLLNRIEYHNELEHQSYQKPVAQFLKYQEVEFNELELVFQKQ